MAQPSINDFVLSVATVNGSGSQSSNLILLKSLFRMGIPTGGKNLFPSNIAGLPTWFSIRANKDGYTGRNPRINISVGMNPETISEDIKAVYEGGVFIYNDDLPFDRQQLRTDITNFGIPFRTLVDGVSKAIKTKKFLTNMIYVGVLARLLEIDQAILEQATLDQFGGKAGGLVEENLKAIRAGFEFADQNFKGNFPFKAEKMDTSEERIIIDGNTAAALGSLYGGCSFVSWYPITPSSSLAESFSFYAGKYRKNEKGKNTFAIVQAEDELSAVGMVLGAGWSGCRAMTATSGPGVSLMAEFVGYSYYTEIPAVIWNVQRCGPSTGLPTRTSQGDILSTATLSHGDTRHILLFPSNPNECFEYGTTAFDLAERLQTVVFVMSDLDVGMNHWIANPFEESKEPYDRGKVLNAKALEKVSDFARYEDVDGDGIPYRTLPGTHHPKAPFFTRGSGHDEKARYTENNETYERVLDRLKKKFETAKSLVPSPEVDEVPGSDAGIIAFGSTDIIMKETRDLLAKKGLKTSYLRLKAYPFSREVEKFLNNHKRVFVVEQNRDGQVHELLMGELGRLNPALESIRHYDGLPIYAEKIAAMISKELGK